MDIKKIRLERKDGYSCVDRVVQGISKWIGKDYEMMFGESWGFQYSKYPKEKRIGDRLKHNTGEKDILLKEYHGIEIIENMTKCCDREMEIIKNELKNNRPVVIEIDCYWCDWDTESFKRNHSFHWLMVIDFDEKTEELICIDSEKAKEPQRLSKENFFAGTAGYFLFNFSDDSKEVSLKVVLENALKRIYDEEKSVDVFKEMQELSEDIKTELDFEYEVSGNENNPVTARMFKELHQIASGRKHFSFTLEYMNKSVNDPRVSILISMLREASNEWSSVFGMMIKAYFITDREKILKRVSEKILEVCNLEKRIFKNAEAIIECDDTGINYSIEEESQEYLSEINSYEFVDISGHFNGKGICVEGGTKYEAELSNPRRYMIIDDVPGNNILNVDNMRFNVENIPNKERDNISCNEQIINIDSVEGKCIMFLACAEFGGYCEKVKVTYEDDSFEEIKITVSSWLSTNSEHGEVEALVGSGVLKVKNKEMKYSFKVRTYAKCYALKSKKKIKNIILPSCLNIHIFGITIGR